MDTDNERAMQLGRAAERAENAKLAQAKSNEMRAALEELRNALTVLRAEVAAFTSRPWSSKTTSPEHLDKGLEQLILGVGDMLEGIK